MNPQSNSLATSQQSSFQLKESIRDMIQLQHDYQLSDELFWEIFNARVLLNEDVNVDDFVRGLRSPVGRA